MAEVQLIPVEEYPDEFVDIDHVLIDVREVDEYESGHLPGAINIPLSEFQARVAEVPTGKTVVLVCQRGGRSQMAGDYLMASGQYPDVINLDGGTAAWVQAGNTLER